MAKQRWGRNPATGKPVLIKSKAKPTAAKPKAKTKTKPKAKMKPKAKTKTKTKPATKPSPAAKPSGDLLRGVALVEAALAHRAKTEALTGMSPGEIAGIDFAGKPLSPGLARWLATDREMFTLGSPQSIVELCDSELDEWASSFVGLGRFLTGPCVLFEGWGADSRRFLYLGATDEHGEYPVFTIDIDDTPFACLNGPVDVWLAQQVELLAEEEYYGFVPKAYEPTRQALAKACFGGFIAHIDGQFSKSLS